jgi:hypothetical protein
MISGVNRSANNIFASTSGSLSRLTSSSGSASESDLRGLSGKDLRTSISIAKDEVEYEFEDGMYEQGKKWQDEDFDRAFGTFS